jgi:predicted membrane-bound spermidine synthase
VLGGGDGLAVREILKHPSVTEVVLVDLDPEITRLAVSNPLLRDLNQSALLDPRVRVVNEDAFVWLGESAVAGLFDAAIVVFPIRTASLSASSTLLASTPWSGPASTPPGSWPCRAPRP